MKGKRILKSILFPHPALVWLGFPCAFMLLIYSMLALDETDTIRIASYALSFYALIVASVRIPRMVQWLQRFKKRNSFLVRYTSDVQIRINISLVVSLGFNAVYAVFQLCLGIRHHSAWFYAMAGYYLLLALLRLMLVKYTKRHAPGEQLKIEWRKYRLTGIFLGLITLALGVFILYFIRKIRIFRHHEITTIAMAAYTFSAFAIAVRNAVRYKRYQSPAYSAAKAVSLVSAVVSVLILENAMLTTFGQENSGMFQRTMIGITGFSVVLAVQGISIYMIVNANRRSRHDQ